MPNHFHSILKEFDERNREINEKIGNSMSKYHDLNVQRERRLLFQAFFYKGITDRYLHEYPFDVGCFVYNGEKS